MASVFGELLKTLDKRMDLSNVYISSVQLD